MAGRAVLEPVRVVAGRAGVPAAHPAPVVPGAVTRAAAAQCGRVGGFAAPSSKGGDVVASSSFRSLGSGIIHGVGVLLAQALPSTPVAAQVDTLRQPDSPTHTRRARLRPYPDIPHLARPRGVPARPDLAHPAPPLAAAAAEARPFRPAPPLPLELVNPPSHVSAQAARARRGCARCRLRRRFRARRGSTAGSSSRQERGPGRARPRGSRARSSGGRWDQRRGARPLLRHHAAAGQGDEGRVRGCCLRGGRRRRECRAEEARRARAGGVARSRGVPRPARRRPRGRHGERPRRPSRRLRHVERTVERRREQRVRRSHPARPSPTPVCLLGFDLDLVFVPRPLPLLRQLDLLPRRRRLGARRAYQPRLADRPLVHEPPLPPPFALALIRLLPGLPHAFAFSITLRLGRLEQQLGELTGVVRPALVVAPAQRSGQVGRAQKERGLGPVARLVALSCICTRRAASSRPDEKSEARSALPAGPVPLQRALWTFPSTPCAGRGARRAVGGAVVVGARSRKANRE